MDILPIIGIDLGTTNSCVAIVQDGEVKILDTHEGVKLLPSYVAFTEEERLVGHEAKNLAHKYAESTIFDTKRLMGRKFYDEQVIEDMKQWPFKVINNSGNPVINISVKNEVKIFSPEEVAAMIIQKLKNIAEEYLHTPITQAVITVPAYFNDAQRQATKDAGTIAGVKVLKVLNEPTAAAIAYGWENKSDVARKILIYDLGGGTFDVSIVKIDGGLNEVIGTDGDTHLGGCNFDVSLVNYFTKQYEEKFSKDLSEDHLALRRIRAKCEELKIKLSQIESTEVEFESLNGEDFYSEISREQFEQLNENAFLQTIDVVKRCLETVNMKKEEIDDIVLIGGSTRIPKIRQLLVDYFGKEPSSAINPDESVAMGAAIQAVILSGDKTENFADFKIEDVTSMAFGTSIQGGLMSIVINQNVKIPTRATKTYYTVKDKQRVMDFIIYQGNRAIAAENYELGEFSINGLTQDLPGRVKVEAIFSIDTNGILTVTATEVATAKTRSMNINVRKNGLTDEEIEEKKAEAIRMAEEDAKKKEIIHAKNNLEAYCIKLKSSVAYSKKLEGHKKKLVKDTCDDIFRWLDSITWGEIKDIQEKHEEVRKVCQPIVDEV